MGWPKGRPMHRTLGNDDLAALAFAANNVTTAALARQLDKPYFTVAHARQKLRRDGGWLCRLVWLACTECGQPLASATAPKRTAHPWCEASRGARFSRERRSRRAPGSLSTPYVAQWRREHPDRNRALREHDKARMRAQWPALSLKEQEALLDRLHAADRRDYPITLNEAAASHQPWTTEEDQYVLAHLRDPAREVALTLGRTLWAVRGRRVRLRRALSER